MKGLRGDIQDTVGPGALGPAGVPGNKVTRKFLHPIPSSYFKVLKSNKHFYASISCTDISSLMTLQSP